MKKILLSIVFILLMSFGAKAQNDAFVLDYGTGFRDDEVFPILPSVIVGTVVEDMNAAAPLGEGLAILTALGAGYAMTRRKNKNRDVF